MVALQRTPLCAPHLSSIDDWRPWGLLMQDSDTEIADRAKALAHPARLRILRLLLATPGCIGGDIVEAVGLAQSTVSEHLRILKAAGVITGEISGPRTCYALNPAALEPLAEFIGTLTAPSAAVCCMPDEKELS
ncbi:metalloregulator ArsR/SmtB family transcription factor [Paracoccus kondratievae]|nr:MAG: transcriptional regulator [Alphaproteobacteria bacterium HGW-Alphaproteobacteria-4]QFQ87434.1 metalloregulator ArsR/SmtB family transcription factor [Paracoccus kondratievae]